MGRKYQVSPEYMESLTKVLVEMEEKGELQKSLDPEKYQEIIDILTKEGKINRPQKMDKINAIIENDKLTHDVLYGSTPMDMLSRAGSNEEDWKNSFNFIYFQKDKDGRILKFNGRSFT